MSEHLTPLKGAGHKLYGHPQGADYQAHLIEQYKLYVDSSMKVTEWRSAANQFFVTLSTGMIGVSGLVASSDHSPAVIVCLCAAGLVLCAAWASVIESYRALNTAKFKVIHEIERELPLRLFECEWDRREKEHAWVNKPSHVERVIPAAFAALFVAIMVLCQQGAFEARPFEIEITKDSAPLTIESR